MKKILIVIDMQNDFIDGSLGTKEAEAIVSKVRRKILRYDLDNVFLTLDTHSKNYLETQEGKMLPVVHCIKGTEGWKLNPKIEEVTSGATRIIKSGFGSYKLVNEISKIAKKEEMEIEIVGLCTDVCVVVHALLLKAKLPEVKITVDSKCCAGITPEGHKAALETMRSCQIIIK